MQSNFKITILRLYEEFINIFYFITFVTLRLTMLKHGKKVCMELNLGQ